MLDGLGETKTRVKTYLSDTEPIQLGEFGGEIVGKGVDNIGVLGVLWQLHGGRSATHVHQDIGHSERGDSGEHLRVELSTRDVVDDVGTRLYRLGGRKAVAGVDRENGVWRQLVAEQFDNGDQTGSLFVGTEQLSTRTRGDGTDVDDVGTIGKQLSGVSQDDIGRGVAATIVEGVGRDVENPHYHRVVEGGFTTPTGEGER